MSFVAKLLRKYYPELIFIPVLIFMVMITMEGETEVLASGVASCFISVPLVFAVVGSVIFYFAVKFRVWSKL